MVDNAMASFGEDIIWWSELYNIELVFVHCRAFTWSPCIHSHVESWWRSRR